MKTKIFLKPITSSLKKLNLIYKKKISKSFKTKKKFQIDPVTILDIRTENIIRKNINKYFPDHNIVGEEKRNKITKSNYTWFIDPVDGTKSMIMGLPTWSNLVGLYKKDKCILSFANFPQLKKYNLAYDNKCLIFENNKFKKIKTNKNVNLKRAKLAINTLGILREKKLLKYIMKYNGFFKVTGVDALNFCSIADGNIDILIEDGLKLVDIMPLVLIVKNSGALITDWKGGLNFSKGRVLVCANKKIQKFYLNILKRI